MFCNIVKFTYKILTYKIIIIIIKLYQCYSISENNYCVSDTLFTQTVVKELISLGRFMGVRFNTLKVGCFKLALVYT